MRPTVPLLRDLVMLALGSGGMVHELFVGPAPNMMRLSASIGLLLGPAALASWWLRNVEPRRTTPTAVGRSPSPSSSPPPGS